MQYLSHYESPLGKMTIAVNEDSLIGLWFVDQKYFGATLLGEIEQKETPISKMTKEWLDIYFQGEIPNFLPPISFSNPSPFRQKALELLLTIPYGKTVTYGEIAQEIEMETGRRVSSQAVGGAVGHNPISIIVPCHRVIGSNGSLTGYAGGIDKKKYLLELEGIGCTEKGAVKKIA